jgi:hypothetical protein
MNALQCFIRTAAIQLLKVCGDRKNSSESGEKADTRINNMQRWASNKRNERLTTARAERFSPSTPWTFFIDLSLLAMI